MLKSGEEIRHAQDQMQEDGEGDCCGDLGERRRGPETEPRWLGWTRRHLQGDPAARCLRVHMGLLNDFVG